MWIGPGRIRLAKGAIIAAPSTGSGKTIISLGLMNALKRAGYEVGAAKVGPDYIDPRFHEVATGSPSFNLDSWAMRTDLLDNLVNTVFTGNRLCLIEGVMGLFDGTSAGRGSTAEIVQRFKLPIIFIVNVAGQAQSTAALVKGFRDFEANCEIKGLILNRVASARHESLLRASLDPLEIPILGTLPTLDAFARPSRHLGLKQANEIEDQLNFVSGIAGHIEEHIDLEALIGIMKPPSLIPGGGTKFEPMLQPLGQRIAIARDEAFSFTYPHILESWKKAGAELLFFSPLGDESPDRRADAIFLPGGYPELHAGRLSTNGVFLSGLREAAANNILIYGECGGYMVLGKQLTDKSGISHSMAGLLPVSVSMANPRLHLGYRHVRSVAGLPWTGDLTAHEFHYARVTEQSHDSPLFQAWDADGTELAPLGHRDGNVMGSFIHVIDRIEGEIDRGKGDSSRMVRGKTVTEGLVP